MYKIRPFATNDVPHQTNTLSKQSVKYVYYVYCLFVGKFFHFERFICDCTILIKKLYPEKEKKLKIELKKNSETQI